MEEQEINQKIKDFFVEIIEDKFTKVKTIKCKPIITWGGKDLENKFLLTKNLYSHELDMNIDYRHKDDIDSVYFSMIYTNTDDGYPEMANLKMYLILDNETTIELSDASGFNHTSQSSKVGERYINTYVETAQLAVSMSDFIAIANANKIEYSIRFGQGSLENLFNEEQNMIFKGFYNASFDNEFETQTILDSIKGRFIQNELLSNFQRFINSAGYTCVKTEINIEQFRFTPHHKTALVLDTDEEIIIATYSNSINKSLCDVLITNKRLYYFSSTWAKVKSIDLKGTLNFEVGKNLLGIDKLIEKKSSFSIIILISGIAFEIAKILNSVVTNNNNKTL